MLLLYTGPTSQSAQVSSTLSTKVSLEIEKELDSEEVINIDMDSDEVLQEADGFSWDSIIADDDDGDGDG